MTFIFQWQSLGLVAVISLWVFLRMMRAVLNLFSGIFRVPDSFSHSARMCSFLRVKGGGWRGSRLRAESEVWGLKLRV